MRHVVTGLLLLASSVALAASPIELKLTPRGSITAPPPPGVALPPGGQGRLVDRPEVDIHAFLAGGPTVGHPLPTNPGVAPSTNIALVNPGFSGFEGLNLTDQTNAGTGIYAGTQGILEPPDQGLCAGHGFVVEAVNLALAVYDENGKTLAGPVAFNQFFGLPPELSQDGTTSGDFLSDPKCIYDWTADRWYVSILQIDVNPQTGALARNAHTLIARSRTGDPTGAWDAFSLDSTNDGTNGTPSHPRCPCLGDQPLLGFDENAIFITTNEFPIRGPGFNGAQVYAIGKAAFDGNGTVALFDNLALEEGTAYSIQPASTPPGGKFDRGGQGTEYFTSSLEFTGGLDDRVAVWAMTGTASLNAKKAQVDFGYTVLKSLVYGIPPPATQKDGPTPLRDLLNSIEGAGTEPLEMTDTNDDRMQQSVYTDHTLWSTIGTIVRPQGDTADRAGIYWFKVNVDAAGMSGRIKANITQQGYLARVGTYLSYPTVAVNARGKGAIAFSIGGDAFYPSTGYAVLDDGGVGQIHVAGAGQVPQDGFTGYFFFGGEGVTRWGDYGAAVAAEDGSIWMASEFTSARPRYIYGNWGTFVSNVKVQ
jgi:hypothetical protein